MFLDYTEIFLIGAFTIIFLYFITQYLTNRAEKYNLYFAIGCLVSTLRTITDNLYGVVDITSSYFQIIQKTDHLSFVWGPVFYIFLANSLFPKIGKKKIIHISIYVSIALSIFILAVPAASHPQWFTYDYFIIACFIYATFIFLKALEKKLNFAIPLFIANIIFLIGVTYDVLVGSEIITSSFGEIHPYTYFIYLYITAIVLSKKYSLIEKQHFESQLNFLHAQIKPHFLYNTINTIRAYCKTDTQKTSELLDYLSIYLRGKFKSGEEMFTPLKDEINLIKAYISIEQLRFEERLSVEYDIDEECDIIIPCLIIQPIVENAVKHGLSPKAEGGSLFISIKRKDDNIIIIIKDDGVGIDESRIDDILNGSESGIGISNTNERLSRFYNTKISVLSILGVGTTFTITIPVKRG